ncbi:MAG: DoxX family protein [Capnocytophaga sp.]|nr:DoxX family protein [Capnocytophaga sp.]
MTKYIKLFLRVAVSTAMLSAVADRFGLWPAEISVWGNMDNFLQYTQSLLPYLPASLANAGGWIATVLEIVFPICLLLGFKTELVAKLSGALIACFGLAMFTSVGLKATFDYSVWNAVGACLAISCLKEKHWEIDNAIK